MQFEINLGTAALQLSQTNSLKIFWALLIALSFNVSYLLFRMDRGIAAMRDCLALAFIGAHGWAAETMVQKFFASVPRSGVPGATAPELSRE